MSFEIPETTYWRTDSYPSTSKMIEEILSLHGEWKSINDINDKTLKHIRLKFFVHIQVEEDIGFWEDYKKSNTRRQITEESTLKAIEEFDNITNKQKRKAFHENGENGKNDCVKKRKKDEEQEEQEERTSSQESIEEMWDYAGKSPLEKSKTEVVNIYKAYKMLEHLIENISGNEKENHAQLLDVEECIQDTHKIIMEDLQDETQTKPGIFSTQKRMAEFNREVYIYPKFENVEYCYDALLMLTDSCNKTIATLRNNLQNTENLKAYFKQAAIFLFGFLTIHPFSDGNGRLGRLLCSYFLGLLCPFPSPIYNIYSRTVRSNYVKALDDARKSLTKEYVIKDKGEAEKLVYDLKRCDVGDLCALIIESNWCTWKEFLNKIKCIDDSSPN